MAIKNRILQLAIISCLLNLQVYAKQTKTEPRFVSIKSSEANSRKGPGIQYPIEWVYLNKWEPVEVLEEYEQWRYIRDYYGDMGWLHVSVVSVKRSVVITGTQDQFLYSDNNTNANHVAILSPELRCKLEKCYNSWCKIVCRGITGWVPAKNLWGLYDSERY